MVAAKNASVTGHQYSRTVLGSLLSISSLPKNFGEKYEFFENPSRQSAIIHKSTESSIHLAQKAFQNRIYHLFLSLLKVNDVFLLLYQV